MNQLYQNYRAIRLLVWEHSGKPRFTAAAAYRQAIEELSRDKPKTRYYGGISNGAGNWQPLDSMPRHSSPRDRAYYAPDWPAGWRLVGRADEVAPHSVKHTGWYTEDGGDTGTLAGYVLRLPHGRLVVATRHSEDDGVTLYPLDSFDDEAECARAADRYAEITAEKERDYQRGWRAGSNAAELERENKELRQSILQICADLKVFSDLPVSRREEESRSRLCGLARGKVTELLAEIYRNRARRDKLREEHYGTAEGYRSGYAEG